MHHSDGPFKVRVAGPGDADAVAEVVAQLNGAVHAVTIEAINAATAGALVLGGDHAALVGLLQSAALGDAEARDRFHAGTVLPLLAFADDGTVAGGLFAHAPWSVIFGLCAHGWPFSEAAMLAAKAVKVGQLWVAPGWRRQGVGAALLSRCCDVYFGAGLRVMFGNLRVFPDPVLEEFYRSAGFRVVAGDKGVVLGLPGGRVVDLLSEGAGLFYRQRAQWQREQMS